MKKLKQTKGVTLIALVITIIVLLILSGISINLMLGEEGVITKAEQAGKNYIDAQKAEQEQLNELCNFVKEEKEEEKEKVYLYNRGNEYIEITGGWKLSKDGNSLSDITTYDYFLAYSIEVGWRGSAITTNKAIKLDEYTKLKMLISKESAGQYNLFRFGIKTTPIVNVAYNAFDSNDIFKEITYSGENIVIEMDIENIQGEYYVGCDLDTTLTKIYEIWFE